MKEEFRYDVVLGIVGFIISVGGLYVNNNLIVVFGIISLIFYFVTYLKELYLDKINESEAKIKELQKEINTSKELSQMKQRLSKIEGMMEMLKNKKASLEWINPLTITVALLLVLMLIMYLRQNGIIQ